MKVRNLTKDALEIEKIGCWPILPRGEWQRLIERPQKLRCRSGLVNRTN